MKLYYYYYYYYAAVVQVTEELLTSRFHVFALHICRLDGDKDFGEKLVARSSPAEVTLASRELSV